VETVYPHDGLSLVTQREVGLDTLSFKNALKSGMRNAPNVVLVGEMRTNEEIDATIEAADTGHLTMSTLHTKSAEETLLRIMSKFDGEDRRDILARLSSNLVGIMSQQLLQRKDGKGQVAVHEVLKIDRKVKEMVMQGDVLGIHDYMMDNKVSMDHQLLRMVVHNEIKYSEALGHAMDVNEFVELAHGPRLSMLIDYNE
jgi:Tfp pilus assembly pilus retraction ATPase PilT